MDLTRPRARTPQASGLLRILTALGAASLGACTSVGAPAPPSERVPVDPPISQAAMSPSQEAAAALLLREMEASLAAGDAALALTQATRVITEYPAAQGASRAFWVVARAQVALENPEEALTAAANFLELLPNLDPRADAVRLLMGRTRLGQDQPVEAVEVLLNIRGGEGDPPYEQARAIIESVVEVLTQESLAELSLAVVPPPTLAAPLLAELALTRFLAGDEEGARLLADQAIVLGVRDRGRELAEAVLDGDLGEFAVEPVFGLILPVSGSPSLRNFAQLIQDGIQVALSEADRPGTSRQMVEILVRDNRGNPLATGPLVDELEAQGVMAILGPLQQASLIEAVAGRVGSTPMISPTSPVIPSGQSDVYSLGSSDPGAAQALALYAADAGFTTAVTLFPEVAGSRLEAEAFREVFIEGGGTMLEELAYAPGTTFWETQLRRIEELLPDVVVLPVPARDVELLAPQVTFFGLDSLSINVLGTTAWSQVDVLQRIDPRHTNGVIVAARQRPGAVYEGQERFRIAYEAFHQHSLRSPVPALGFDATNLLLEGIRRGARSPAQLAAALEGISGYEGATGQLSIQDGRIVRQHFVVCTQDRAQLEVPDRARPLPLLLPALPDSTGEIPEDAPDRIVGFECPTVSPIFAPDSLASDTLQVGAADADTFPLGAPTAGGLIDSLGGR